MMIYCPYIVRYPRRQLAILVVVRSTHVIPPHSYKTGRFVTLCSPSTTIDLQHFLVVFGCQHLLSFCDNVLSTSTLVLVPSCLVSPLCSSSYLRSFLRTSYWERLPARIVQTKQTIASLNADISSDCLLRLQVVSLPRLSMLTLTTPQRQQRLPLTAQPPPPMETTTNLLHRLHHQLQPPHLLRPHPLPQAALEMCLLMTSKPILMLTIRFGPNTALTLLVGATIYPP